MREILSYIVEYCSFLWDGRYRFVESEVSPSFGGQASLLISSDALSLRFVRDRGQLFLDFQEPNPKNAKEWYSADLVRWIISGNDPGTSLLSPEFGEFLQAHFREIESRFGTVDIWPDVKNRLKEVRRLRDKKRFN
jgi:hypothetical protein